MLSMTGYGHAELTRDGTTCSVELRSVNSRFLEVVSRLPRSLAQRENDVKDLIRGKVNRGKISLSLSLEKGSNGELPLSVNAKAAKSYYKLLNQLRKAVKIREQVKLEHLLKFSEVLETAEDTAPNEEEWQLVEDTIARGLDELNSMRSKEGGELGKDLEKRIHWMEESVNTVERLSKERIPEERKRLNERVEQLVSDKTIIDQNRLELELALLAEKLDVTEECVRFRSHTKFFLEAMREKVSAGRKLNFLVQEINREANTIGSKSNDAEIGHIVVQLKEELEKIREQIQNIE
jgi:uncharacterized protein (TIGR00255 family)